MPVDPVRDAAIDVLLRVFERDVYLSRSLDKTLRRKGGLSSRGKRFLAQLVYGTVRHKMLADHVLASRVHQPLGELPAPILAVLRMGVFQALFCNQVTFPSMVHTSVDLAKKRGHAGTAKLVNAVLNRAPQSLDQVALPDRETSFADFLSIRYSTPRWIVDRWIAEFGATDAERISAASAEEAKHTVRVNTLKTDRDALIKTLAKAEIGAVPYAEVPDAVIVIDGGGLARTKAHQNGLFYVQDPASMLPSALLEPRAGERILDLCAAPGGKATHIAQLTGNKGFVVANDIQPNKFEMVRENAEKLGVTCVHCVAANGASPPFRAVFDRVLVDAPCTGLGTLRRHPELKYRARPEDPARLAAEQTRLLRAAIHLCKNGGVIVYSVCTFTPEETMGVLDGVRGSENVELEDGPEWLNQWKIHQGMYRVLPGGGPLDGYFLTRLRKRS